MKVKSILVVEGGFNLLVCISKLVVGLATGSSSILADAFHSLSDLFNNFIAFLAVHVAEQPADHSHQYGHRKFEQLAVFVLATSLVFIAIELLHRVINGDNSHIVSIDWAIVLMGFIILLNLALSFWQQYYAVKLGSDILAADARHTFADSLTSLLAIAGWQLGVHVGVWVDSLVTLMMAALLFYFAFQLFSRSIPILVDASLEETGDIRKTIEQVEGVISVGRCRTRTDGTNRFADVVVFVDPVLSTEEGHDIADNIEQSLQRRFAIVDTTVHLEPSTKA